MYVTCFNRCETFLTAARALQLSFHLHLRPPCFREESRHANFTEGAQGETSGLDCGFFHQPEKLVLDRFTSGNVILWATKSFSYLIITIAAVKLLQRLWCCNRCQCSAFTRLMCLPFPPLCSCPTSQSAVSNAFPRRCSLNKCCSPSSAPRPPRCSSAVPPCPTLCASTGSSAHSLLPSRRATSWVPCQFTPQLGKKKYISHLKMEITSHVWRCHMI